MLTRSVVAALCGALAVAGLPGHGEFQDDVDAFEGYDWQETFVPPVWAEDLSELDDEEHPKHPPFPTRPHLPHPHDEPPVDDKTIYQALEEDTRFSRLFKLVNYTEDITKLLNDSSASVTFFAVPDKGLQPPKHHKHSHHKLGFNFDNADIDPLFNTFAADLASSTDEADLFSLVEGFVDYDLLQADDDDKERRKKIIKAIVTAVLKYHILPGELPAGQLASNNTYATTLKLHEGSLDAENLRLRVFSEPRLLHPKIKVNFYADVLHPNVQTENGIVHVINHPLFPPPSIFTILFAFPDAFSTVTSALQRANITDAIDWHWVRSSHSLEGSPAVTFFVPTNEAFFVLPKKLKLFLFSPFGARALKKILAYHVVPDYVFHSNWAHNASADLWSQPRDVLEEDTYSYLRSEYLNDVDPPFEDEEDVNAKIAGRQGCAPRMAQNMWEQPQPKIRLCTYDGQCRPESPLRHTPVAMPLFMRDDAPPFPPRFPGPPDHEDKPPRPHLPHPKPVYTLNATLPTLLPNHTLHVHVAQFKSVLPHGGFHTTMFVNGRWVNLLDVPTRNGAVHIVKRLIRPFKKHEEHKKGDAADETWFQNTSEEEVDSEWDDWEEWLPQWANED